MPSFDISAYEELPAGLYLIPTPIGNLDDITLRALRTFASLDLLLVEDTRSARRLLSHYGLTLPLQSLHRDNEAQRAEALLAGCLEGKRIGYSSEAGMPGISDPGFVLVRSALAMGIAVTALPGASAGITALVASGLPCDRFLFLGFLPHKRSRRRQALASLTALPLTLILYLSPHRLHEEIDDIREILGNRQACLAREITKRFEEYLRGSLTQIQDALHTREHRLGELVLLLEGSQDTHRHPLHDLHEDPTSAHDEASHPSEENETLASSPTPSSSSPHDAFAHDAKELLESGCPLSKAAKELANRWPALTRKEAYDYLLKLQEQEQDESQ
jgi:16S rRNA (cytidine1402-2'-O)-methyltransferase